MESDYLVRFLNQGFESGYGMGQEFVQGDVMDIECGEQV